MAEEADAIIIEGREAWQRIKAQERPTFSDWMTIGVALLVGRARCMSIARCNRPYGIAYQRLIAQWLKENGLSDIDSHERRNAILMAEHRAEIEAWRSTLTAAERRRNNHCNSVMARWRSRTRPQRPGPKRAVVPSPSGRAIYWPQETVRAAALAMKETMSRDWFTLARVALETAIRTDADLLALFESAKPTVPRSARTACRTVATCSEPA